MLATSDRSTLTRHIRYAINEGKLVFSYRGTLVLATLGPVILVAVQLVLWSSVYASRNQVAGLTFVNTITYIIFARLWAFIVPGFTLGTTFERRVRDGSVAQDLLRPGSMITSWLSRAIGRSAAWLAFMAPVGIAAGLLLRPAMSASDLALVIGYVIAGYLIAFSLAAGVAVCALLLRRVDGLNEMRDAVVALLGGAIIPLDFYPNAFREIIRWTPFRFIYYEPIMVLTGVDAADPTELLIACAWAVGLLLLIASMLVTARRRLVLDGG